MTCLVNDVISEPPSLSYFSHGYPIDPIALYRDSFVRYDKYDCGDPVPTENRQPRRRVAV
jgi:hypothetical protein